MEGSFSNKGDELRFGRPRDNAAFVYRVAALIIRNEKLLAVSNITLPGLYYLVGGAVNIHETSQEAVIREVQEEIGIRLEVEQLAFVAEEFLSWTAKNSIK